MEQEIARLASVLRTSSIALRYMAHTLALDGTVLILSGAADDIDRAATKLEGDLDLLPKEPTAISPNASKAGRS